MDPTTVDGFNGPDAHLMFFPILSRNPGGFDNCKLSHKRQRPLNTKDAFYLQKADAPAITLCMRVRREIP